MKLNQNYRLFNDKLTFSSHSLKFYIIKNFQHAHIFINNYEQEARKNFLCFMSSHFFRYL